MKKYSVFLLIIFMLAGCRSEEKQPPGISDVYDKDQIHYLITAKENWFEKTDSIPPYSRTGLLPWPLQKRITDFIQFYNLIIFGVNGMGVAYFDVEKDGLFVTEIDFAKIESDKIFNNRTLGKLYFFDNRLLCHVYNDVFFAIPQNELQNKNQYLSSPLVHINVLQQTAEVADSFKTKDNIPHNAVQLLLNGSVWYSASRLSGSVAGTTETAFRYYMFDTGESTAVSITEEDFLNAHPVYNISSAPNSLKLFAEYLKREKIPDRTIIEIFYGAESFNSKIIYRLTVDDLQASGYEKIFACNYGNGEYFYTYRNKMYYTDKNGMISVIKNAELPDNHMYTKIRCIGDILVASWEYQDFYQTGDSGFSLYDIRKFEKLSL